MVPLITNRRMLTWLCVYPAEGGTTKWKKLAHISLTIIALAISLSSFGMSTYAFLHSMDTDLETSLFCLLQMVGEMNVAYIIVVTVFYREEITEILESLSKIYKKRKIATSFLFRECLITNNCRRLNSNLQISLKIILLPRICSI